MTGTSGPAPEARTVEVLRAWYRSFGELGRRFGTHLGMHTSDAAALVQITGAEERGTPLTQSQLSRRIGLTTPATSSLLNRLETAGHVTRTRDSADRRVVTVRSTPAVHEEVQDFFADVGRELDEIVSSYPPETVRAFEEMIGSMTAVLDRHADQRS